MIGAYVQKQGHVYEQWHRSGQVDQVGLFDV
jgi:hypothetical protein